MGVFDATLSLSQESDRSDSPSRKRLRTTGLPPTSTGQSTAALGVQSFQPFLRFTFFIDQSRVLDAQCPHSLSLLTFFSAGMVSSPLFDLNRMQSPLSLSPLSTR